MWNGILGLGFLCFFGSAIHAQYTIPDPAFAAKLQVLVPNAMNGNVLDENHPNVTSLTSMAVQYSSISNLDGVQFFTGLTTLNCSGNQLGTLPDLPSSMTTLRCESNQLASLPPLPSALTSLYCRSNQISSLPALPNTLTYLDCGSNQLSSLPTLPNTLSQLDCGNNQLNSLPTLPNSLFSLVCSNNELTNLPTLPTSLSTLYCRSNQLTSFPTLPNTLAHFYCDHNQLNSLPVLPNDLYNFQCNYNQLTSLPALPNSLWLLGCDHNQLTNLPTLPNNLELIYCSFNQLTSLPTLPNSLFQIQCQYNQLTNLPSLPNSLTSLDIYSNSISALPSLPSTLIELICANNSLSALPQLPNTLEELNCRNNTLTCLPTLSNSLIDLRCSGNSINCLPNVPLGLSPSSNILGFTPVLCSTTDPCFPPEAITGTIFNDANGNGLQDAGETAFLSGVAEAQPGNNLSGVDVNGSFGIPVEPGSYTVQGQGVLYHTITTPAHNVTITAGMSATDKHIGYQAIPGIYDLVAELTAGVTRPGFDNNVYFSVSNIGTEASTATINFDFDTDQNWVSATVAPNAQVVNNATWSIAMDPGDTWTARVTLNTPASVALGTGIQHQLTATPDAPDTTPADNMATWTRTVVGSYDPNDKVSSVSSLTPTEAQNGAWIDYTIRFQNTGTFMAENVLITDTLPPGLQANTFRYVASSHSNFWYMEAGVLHVRYDHIQLPHINANEPASHGFIKFRIKANTALIVGEEIENVANIYFDFNAPIITDPSVITIASPGIAISPKVMLGGPYVQATQLMSDGLRSGGLIPLTEPYTAQGYSHVNGGGGETTTSAALAVTGNNAIVDWVVVELRSTTAPYGVLATRSALVQRDGDVVAASGSGPVMLFASAGNYRVAVRHRNHLGTTAVRNNPSSAD